MILIKIKKSDKIEKIKEILHQDEYSIINLNDISLYKRILNKISFGYFFKSDLKEKEIYNEQTKNYSDFLNIVNDKYINKYPYDNRYKNLPIHILNKIKESTFDKYPNSFNWDDISSLNLSSDFIMRNFEKLNKKKISIKPLPNEVIIQKYTELDIPSLMRVNDMIQIYISLYYKKDSLTQDESSFIAYLNVWDIVEDYKSQLIKLDREDIVNYFMKTYTIKDKKEKKEINDKSEQTINN